MQKVHANPSIPRVGGIALLLGFIAGLIGFQTAIWLPFMLLSFLAFITGFIDDVLKGISPAYRLVLSFIVAGLACWLLNIDFHRSGAEWVDQQLLSSPLLAYPLAIFMIAGVMHAFNIIDGCNGLMLGCAILFSAALLFITLKVGDSDLAVIFLILIMALCGILVFNYPWGKIFMGDGGAYLVGFILATSSLLLINRNPQVSPWFPLVVMAYPVWETLFSIVRRVFVHKQPPGEPDLFHLHSIIYKRFRALFPRFLSHSFVGPVLCLFNLLSIAPAIYYWNKTIPLILISFAFVALYIACYLILVSIEKYNKSGLNSTP